MRVGRSGLDPRDVSLITTHDARQRGTPRTRAVHYQAQANRGADYSSLASRPFTPDVVENRPAALKHCRLLLQDCPRPPPGFLLPPPSSLTR